MSASAIHLATDPLAVRLTRNDGQLRRRFSPSERRRVLDATPEELNAFVRLFAPRQTPYLIQRADVDGRRGQWATVAHRLTEDLIVKHLLANQLAGATPLWIGTSAWAKTRFVAIDVDNRANGFADRCERVEKVLYRLGIPENHWLIQTSPSGGRHYFFFTFDPIPTDEIRPVFKLAGLSHENGVHEIYPDQKHGFRLPFGWVPGAPHDPNTWKFFIGSYSTGHFPRINWQRCKVRAIASSRLKSASPPASAAAAPSPARKTSSKSTGPRAPRSHSVGHRARGTDRPQVAPKEILERGIRAPGERRYLSQQLAWHLLFARRMCLKQVVEVVIDWVYRTGEHTSHDVKQDLEQGTRRVADDTNALVSHIAAKLPPGQLTGKPKFAPSELYHLLQLVDVDDELDPQRRLRFAIDLLNFAKNTGRQVDAGWECRPAIRGVVQTWNGCSGMRYKPFMDWAIRVGLIELVREKRQSSNGTGRARTYYLKVPVPRIEEITLSYSRGLEYVANQIGSKTQESSSDRTFRGVSGSDTYSVMIASLKGRNPQGKRVATDRSSESVGAGSSIQQSAATSQAMPPDSPVPPHAARRGLFNERCTAYSNPFGGRRSTATECQHPPCASARVAACKDERPAKPDALPRVLHSPPGHGHSRLERALSPDLTRPRPGANQQSALLARGSPTPALPPDPADRLGIAAAIEKLKQLAATIMPRRVVEQLPRWAAIEAMAADHSYSTQQRRLLLTPGNELNHQQVCTRNQLITQWRRRQNE